jgi:tetratricopeptide (TPR) repeat protein
MLLLITLSMGSLLFSQVESGNGKASSTGSTHDAEALVQSAMTAEKSGDLKTAIEDYRKALALRPDLMDAHVGLGGALVAAGQLDEAIDEDTRALVIAPGNAALGTNLGQAYYRKGDLGHARSQFETVHRANPGDVNAAVLLGYTYIRMSREADAADLLMPMEAGHEDNLDLEYVLSYAMIRSGREADGVPRMEKVAKAKNSAEAWVVAGSARYYRNEGDDMVQARADLDAAVALNPNLPGLQTMAGQARYAMLDYSAAAIAFQAALRADPMDFVANRDLGAMRLKGGDTENARPLLELAFQLHPDDPLTRIEFAKLNDQTGRYAEALAILDGLIKSEPRWSPPHWVLAQVYAEMKRPEDAKRERAIAHEMELKEKADKK